LKGCDSPLSDLSIGASIQMAVILKIR